VEEKYRKIQERRTRTNKRQMRRKKDLSKFDSPTGRDKANSSVSQSSSTFGNSTSHTPVKEVYFEFTQTFSLSRSSTMRNEFTGSFKYYISVRYVGVYPADRLPKVWTRLTAIVVNTGGRPQSIWRTLGRFLHR